jgi:hypothetical protein
MSVLDNGRYNKEFGEPMRRWVAALEEYIATRRREDV